MSRYRSRRESVAFTVVGLPDKAVGESRLSVCARRWFPPGSPLPSKRITVNLGAPADLPKEGSHYDLADQRSVSWPRSGRFRSMRWRVSTVLGELALDGSLTPGRRRVAGGDGSA